MKALFLVYVLFEKTIIGMTAKEEESIVMLFLAVFGSIFG
jgi:hypothetical protein